MHTSKLSFAIAAALTVTLLVTALRTTVIDAASAEQPLTEGEFDQRVRDYLLNNPEVIVEAIQKWQAQQRQAQAQQAGAVLAERRDEIFNDPSAPVGGNPDGDVTVVEFMDYNCGYCRKVYSQITRLTEQDPNVRVLFKEFPVLGPGSQFAARAALASRSQNLYQQFHDAMMRSNQRLEKPQVLAIAEQVGLDVARLQAEMDNPEHQQAIDRNTRLAQALAITGTPGFVIGDEIVRGATSLEHLEELVEKARAPD